jgi:hypothetical protein
MHTKKIIMVPHDIAHTKRPVDNVIEKLETDLQNIMQNKSHAADAKLTIYNQVLQRYNKMLQKKQAPYTLDIVEETPSVYKDSTILKGIPEKQQRYANLLLTHVNQNPNIKTNSKGEMIIYGNLIHGSNITDLIHDFSRESRTRPLAIGAEMFAKVLDRSNIPRESIGNRQRLNLFTEPGGWEE